MLALYIICTWVFVLLPYFGSNAFRKSEPISETIILDGNRGKFIHAAVVLVGLISAIGYYEIYLDTGYSALIIMILSAFFLSICALVPVNLQHTIHRLSVRISCALFLLGSVNLGIESRDNIFVLLSILNSLFTFYLFYFRENIARAEINYVVFCTILNISLIF